MVLVLHCPLFIYIQKEPSSQKGRRLAVPPLFPHKHAHNNMSCSNGLLI